MENIKSTLDVSKMLTISSLHLSAKTRDMLDEDAQRDTLGDLGVPVYEKATFGWIIYVPTSPNDDAFHLIQGEKRPQFGDLANMPDDLQAVMQFCYDVGCDVLCLDGDGDQIPYLKTYPFDDDEDLFGDDEDDSCNNDDLPY